MECSDLFSVQFVGSCISCRFLFYLMINKINHNSRCCEGVIKIGKKTWVTLCQLWGNKHNRSLRKECKSLLKRFQHLLQHAFSTLLKQVFGVIKQVIQHCWKHKKCQKLVESMLNWIQIGFNSHSTSIQLFLYKAFKKPPHNFVFCFQNFSMSV